MTKKYILLKDQIVSEVKTSEFPPSATAVQTALAGKVDVEEGKGLSTKDFTAAYETKLNGIAEGAEVNVLEGIQFNGTDATITSKKVNITPALIGAAASSHQHGNADLQTGIDAAKIASISGSKLSMDVIPAGAIPTLKVVANAAARLALTIADVQTGDVVKQNDTGVMYFVKDDTKLGTEDAFEVFKAGEASSVAWENVTGKVEASSTATGILKASDWSAFNGKQDAITDGSKLSSDLVDDTNKTHKFVSADQIAAWTAKQDAITSTNKLGADLIAETATKKFVPQTSIDGWDAHVADSSIHVTTSDKSAWNAKQSAIPAGTSGNVVTYSGTAGTVGSLGFDTAPTDSSNNLVKSGAVKTALDGKVALGTSTASFVLGYDGTGYYLE